MFSPKKREEYGMTQKRWIIRERIHSKWGSQYWLRVTNIELNRPLRDTIREGEIGEPVIIVEGSRSFVESKHFWGRTAFSLENIHMFFLWKSVVVHSCHTPGLQWDYTTGLRAKVDKSDLMQHLCLPFFRLTPNKESRLSECEGSNLWRAH